MAYSIGDELDGVKQGMTSIRLGAAYLEIMPEEIDHYGLYRKIVTKKNDNGHLITTESEQPILVAIYRRAGKGDQTHMKTVHPKTGEAIDLCCVWRPGAEG